MPVRKRKRIGLALSGGGFRAAAFHLGVFRKLDELGLFADVAAISSVSGGAIAGAYIACHWGDRTAIDRLEVFLANESLYRESIAESVFSFKTRTERLAANLDEKLFKGKTLKDLQRPRLFVNATNLGTGNLFTFAGGGNAPAEIGEYELGFMKRPDFLLSRAVAASCAYPVGFVPLRLEKDDYAAPAPYSYTALIDGGVYDNLGINPLLRKSTAIDVLIASDAGLPFANQTEPTGSAVLVVKNTIDILMEQMRGMQFERLMARWKSGSGPRPIWFSIDSVPEGNNRPGDERANDAERAARIPTGLDRLERNDITLLERHGGALLEARVREFL